MASKTVIRPIEENVNSMKEYLNAMNFTTEEFDHLRKSNEELNKRLEHFERYSRDFSVRLLGVEEEEGRLNGNNARLYYTSWLRGCSM